MTLLAAYNFDEASGAVVDVTGNGHDFTPAGNTVRTAGGAGHTDKGLNQTTSSTDAGPAVFGLTATRTMMMWIKSTASVTDGRIFETVAVSDANSIWEFLFRDTAWHLQAWNGATFARATTTRPTDSAWHHLAGTYDGTSLRLYLDGTLVGGPTALTAPLRTDGTTLNIFHTCPTTIIDDVRHYDTALDAATITALMGTPVGASTTPVSTTRATTWRVVARVTSSRVAIWDALARTTATRGAIWDTLLRVTGSRSTTWDALAAGVTATRSTTWAVASTLTSVTATRATTWAVRARITSTRSATWDTLRAVAGSRSTSWDALASRSAVKAATWRVAARVTTTRMTTWNVLSNLELRDVTVVGKLRNNHVTGGVRLSDLVAGLRSNHVTGGVDVPRDLYTGSVEHVIAEATFVGQTAAGIASASGQVQFTTTDTAPAPGDANWVAADLTERTDINNGHDALLTLKKLHTAGTAGVYRVWAKITDSPEVLIVRCGSFTVR